MKEHTKAVLEACTGQLVVQGLSRKRRGLAVWQLNDEMWGGVGMQVQIRNANVTILPVAKFIWEPVERLMAHGKGREFTLWGAMGVTRSKTILGRRTGVNFTFKEPELDGSILDRFGDFVSSEVLPEILDMADERKLLSHFRSEATRGGGRAEHALAILAWQHKSLDLSHDYSSLLTAQTKAKHRVRLEQFHDRLTESQEVRALLGTQVQRGIQASFAV